MTETVESDYYAFMGFDPQNAKEVLSFYTQFFLSGPVVELACGPGVFLGLLRDSGVAAQGVDIDDGMVQQARAAGHEVVLDDAVNHLRALADQSINGLFAAHFLEHLPADEVAAVYVQAYRVLRPGGVFVAAVPNAACLSVLGYDFWRDPTHVRFYDPLALQFFARQAGFVIATSGGNPRNHPGPPPSLLLPPATAVPNLRSLITEAIQRAQWLSRPAEQTQSPVDEQTHGQPEGAPLPRFDQVWGQIGHVLSLLDDRAQALQHELHVTRTAHERLLEQLYPPNEVYVVARVPSPTTPSASSDRDAA